MGLLRRLTRVLGRRVTVLIVPHASLPLWRLRLTVNFIAFGLLLWSAAIIWAGFLIGRNLDYWITKADNQVMRVKVSYMASEIDKSIQDLRKARETDAQMRVLLGMRSRRAIIEQEEGIGGAVAAERMGLLREIMNDPARARLSAVHTSLAAIRRESQQRLASFQEIAWYVANRRSLFRSTPVGLPAGGRVTSGFGFRFSPILRIEGDSGDSGEFHSGVDFANSPDTPVLATADGSVRRAEWASGYGRMVFIEHDWGYATLYGHNSKLLVRKGETVRRGQMIAYMGTTGRSTGTHLHYEVWRNGRPVNPMPFLKPRIEENLLSR